MSQRYFLTAEATYEELRQSLNAALAYPNALGKSVFQTALYAPRDNFRRVLLAVDTDLPGYATIDAAIAPLLDSDAIEEIDEATYLAALATATGGGATFTTVTDTLTYGNFLPSGGTLDLALQGIDSALGGKAAITDIRYKGEWSAGGYGQGDIVYKSVAAGSEVSGYIGTLWVCTDIATSDEPDGTTSAWTRFKAVAESHAHSAADITDFSSAVASASPEEVVEYAATTNFPATGNTSLLYVATDASRFYRWTGSEYVEVGPVALYPAAHTHAASDITVGNWKVIYSNGSGAFTELALGASGTVLTSGGASAAPTFSALPAGGTKSIIRFYPGDNQPPASNFATLDTRNSVLVLEFDAATDESAAFVGYIPEGATLTNGLKVRLSWMADTATSGNVRWGVQFEADGTDLDSDSYDTATLVTSAANGTSGIETVAEITATSIDSLAAGDRFRLRVYRDADDATNDTMTGDAQLVAVEVQVA